EVRRPVEPTLTQPTRRTTRRTTRLCARETPGAHFSRTLTFARSGRPVFLAHTNDPVSGWSPCLRPGDQPRTATRERPAANPQRDHPRPGPGPNRSGSPSQALGGCRYSFVGGG